jgi:hypothetical protein
MFTRKLYKGERRLSRQTAVLHADIRVALGSNDPTGKRFSPVDAARASGLARGNCNGI